MKNARLLIAVVLGVAGLSRTQDKEALHPYQFRISQGVAEKLLIHRVEPDYPAEVRAPEISGQVVIRYVIDRQGNAIGVFAVNDSPNKTTQDARIREATVNAVKQWKFKPYLLNGEPVEVETEVTLSYNFGDQAPAKKSPTPDQSPNSVSRVRISPDIANASVTTRVEPEYPPLAKAGHLQGEVFLNVVIDREGRVANATVLRGHPVLAASALKAVKQWRYKPFVVDGTPRDAETTVKINFYMR